MEYFPSISAEAVSHQEPRSAVRQRKHREPSNVRSFGGRLNFVEFDPSYFVSVKHSIFVLCTQRFSGGGLAVATTASSYSI